ncbi:translation initiation factor [Rhodococcus gordoniae]|uniref:Translation initiation factor n=1 Tax=Rhodococcus gordoniae TaxID=223392 RepID=A0A379M2P4_9NOCA|nr:DUF6319 family protein [Rhodococcus gordoniae]SUE15665.1 translation initiation factor [Rhodococcus gordoniae]
MPPRRRADHLTEDQLGELGTALAEGRRATVYLVEGIPSLGIDPGTSARVVSISGSTVMVRPKGVDDELPFEVDELRATREPAGTKRAPAKAARASGAAKPAPAKPVPAKVASVQPASPQPASPQPTAPKPATPAPAASPRAQEKKPVTQTTSASSDASASRPPAPAKPKNPARTKAKKAPSITITVTIDPENEWTVGVAHGTRKVGKPTPVAPDAVERAVKELGDPTATEAVHSVIDEARRAAEERVAQLSRELEEARQALESLGATRKSGGNL